MALYINYQMSDYDLIIKDLVEVVGIEELRDIAEKRAVAVYWGTAPTGRIHVGYYIPLIKIAELITAGCKVKILIADLHALLDDSKSSEINIKNRTEYYIRAITCMLKQLSVDMTKITFVLGSSFQLSPEYTKDMYRLNSFCTVAAVQHAGSEVIKQNDNPKITGLMYPTLQALDEEYLQTDAQLGGIDQRKICMFARDYLPKIGYRERDGVQQHAIWWRSF